MRCPWSLEAECSGHYERRFSSLFFLIRLLLSRKGFSLGVEILHGVLANQKIKIFCEDRKTVQGRGIEQSWERGPPSAQVIMSDAKKHAVLN